VIFCSALPRRRRREPFVCVATSNGRQLPLRVLAEAGTCARRRSAARIRNGHAGGAVKGKITSDLLLSRRVFAVTSPRLGDRFRLLRAISRPALYLLHRPNNAQIPVFDGSIENKMPIAIRPASQRKSFFL